MAVRKPGWTFLGLTATWLLLGLVMLPSASGPSAYSRFNDAYYYVKHQLVYGILPGLAFFLFAFSFDYGGWRKLAIGLWQYTADFDRLAATTPSGDPVRDDGNNGWYAIADRTLWSGDRGTAAGFLRVGQADDRFNTFDGYLGAGGSLTFATEDFVAMTQLHLLLDSPRKGVLERKNYSFSIRMKKWGIASFSKISYLLLI